MNSKQFNIGDKVIFKYDGGLLGDRGDEVIIHSVSYCGNGEFMYSHSNGAWTDHDKLVLVEGVNKKLLKQLDKEIQEDKDDGEE